MSDNRTNPDDEIPPLRIHHLLVWTALTAMLLSVGLAFDRNVRNGPPLPLWTVIYNLLTAIVIAGALTVVGFGRFWRRAGYPFPSQPGEQLLLLIALGAVGFATVVLGSFAVFFAISDDAFSLIFYGGLIALVVGLMVWCARAARPPEPFAWHFTFWVLAVTPMFAVVFGAAIATRAATGFVLWAAWRDRRLGIPRPWTHWLGVAMIALLGITGGSTFFFQ